MARTTKQELSATEQQVAGEAAVASNEDHRRAAEKRAAAAAGVDARTENEVAGLLDERRGYVTRGLDDRVRQVDEQLARRGYDGGGK